MQTEIRIALWPRQTQFDRQIEKTRNTFYGGARGGGKSHGIREIMVKRRIMYDNSIGVIFRKTWEEVRDNHLNPLLEKFPPLRERYVAGEKAIKFENGSKLLFRHVKDLSSITGKQGQEYHDIAIEEVGDWKELWYEMLRACNRSSIQGIKPRMILAGNPGGVGHKWLKRLFIDRKFKDNEVPEDYVFVPAKVYDNPSVMRNDPEYLKSLESISDPVLRAAWLDGDWDIMAGQFFDSISRETHLIDPFEIPDHWERMGMFDTGYNHPAAFYLMATDTDGNCFVYWEYVMAGRRSEEIAKDLMEHPDISNGKIRGIPAGADCWAKHGGGPSVDEKMSKASGHQISLHKANIDRVAGAQQVRDYLAIRDNGPRLKIFKTCPVLFDCLCSMIHDPKNPEDVLKVDASEGDPHSGDDAYDALRYGLMDRPRISVDPPAPKMRRYYDDDDYPNVNWKTV